MGVCPSLTREEAKGDMAQAYFAIFTEVFTLYSASIFTCSSSYRDLYLLGICSRGERKSCQNFKTVEKSGDPSKSAECISLSGRKRKREARRKGGR